MVAPTSHDYIIAPYQTEIRTVTYQQLTNNNKQSTHHHLVLARYKLVSSLNRHTFNIPPRLNVVLNFNEQLISIETIVYLLN